jgi:hypothetical protein
VTLSKSCRAASRGQHAEGHRQREPAQGPSTSSRSCSCPTGQGHHRREDQPAERFYKVTYTAPSAQPRQLLHPGLLPPRAARPPAPGTPPRPRQVRGGLLYWWGHARFRRRASSSTAGSARQLPSCSHSGSTGGDCPACRQGLAGGHEQHRPTVDKHPYSTYNLTTSDLLALRLPLQLQEGRRAGLQHQRLRHIIIYESGDGWGSMWAYECKGCVVRLRAHLRPPAAPTSARQRHGY